ncbi:hypothetical protein [Aestuariivivens sediminis]|uniref:hypothetical protein n=1 Tax=Aestuariivivens sediminis TaxID=2913557 RepID=UPI001F5854C1|nr:hypothetical protein [Aestuariivivens sediminis]
MKNIIKSIALLIALGVSFNSCLLEDDNLADTFDDGPNFTSFSNTNQTVSAVADGNIVTAKVNVELQGPNMVGFTEDVSLTIGVDAANTTAIEGVHYTLNTNSITLTAANNYIGTIPVSIITEGIDPPLPVAPILTLTFTGVTGTNVINSGKDAKLTLIYQCFADLTGTYMVTNDWCPNSLRQNTTTITKNADGSWRFGTADGYWLDSCTGNAGLFNGGNVVELCGEILPTGDLDFGTVGGFGIGDILGGTWDAENGVITMQHIETFFNGGPREWTSTYTRIP